jgi:hypothetical protein
MRIDIPLLAFTAAEVETIRVAEGAGGCPRIVGRTVRLVGPQPWLPGLAGQVSLDRLVRQAGHRDAPARFWETVAVGFLPFSPRSGALACRLAGVLLSDRAAWGGSPEDAGSYARERACILSRK